MKTIAAISALSWLFVSLAQATSETTPFEYGEKISYAALVWFLVGHYGPKRDTQHREEREGLARIIDKHSAEHSEAIKAVSEASLESSRSGHAAAQALAAEVRSLKEYISRDTPNDKANRSKTSERS